MYITLGTLLGFVSNIYFSNDKRMSLSRESKNIDLLKAKYFYTK